MGGCFEGIRHTLPQDLYYSKCLSKVATPQVLDDWMKRDDRNPLPEKDFCDDRVPSLEKASWPWQQSLLLFLLSIDRTFHSTRMSLSQRRGAPLVMNTST